MVATPDRGWSWVVALAACFNSLVLAGIFRTSGVLFVAFIGTFDVSREEASWPMVVCISVLNLTGPFSGILAQRFGIRPVVILGAVVGAVGVSACFFTTSLTLITVFFGGVFGIGYGLVNTLMPVIVNSYFLNLRTTANGIANSGSCFGSVLLPVLFEFLIENYGLQGCFLLTGAIVLNVAVAGALMRPPAWLKTPTRKLPKNVSSQPSSAFPEDGPSFDHGICEVLVTDCDGFINANKQELPSSSRRKPNIQKLSKADMAVKEKGQDSDTKALVECADDLVNSNSTSSSLCNGFDTDRLRLERLKEQKACEDHIDDFKTAACDIFEVSKSDTDLNKVPNAVSQEDSFSRHSLSSSSQTYDSPIAAKKISSELRLVITNSDSQSQEDTDNETVQMIKGGGTTSKHKAGKDDRTSTVRPSILSPFATVLSSPMFYLTAFTNVSFYFLFHMFVNIIIDYSLDRGVPETNTKYILFAFALTDLFGRLGLGWITDKKYITRTRFMMVGMGGIGVVFLALPFATDYRSLLVVSACYGLLLGCTMVIFPILLVEYLGMEVHAEAYGCLCFMNGFFSITRPFLIGYFRDNFGSYEDMFFILGAISIVAACCLSLERCFMPKAPSLILNDKDVENAK